MLKLKYLYISIYLPLALFVSAGVVLANTNTNTIYSTETKSSITIVHSVTAKKIDREGALKKFFTKYNSPLANNVGTFIKVADKYKIDYKLLPSISCMESTCARFLIPGTYNPFGWGAGRIKFASYDEAIESVAKGLNEIYLSRGLDNAEKIAPVYNPPSPHSWTKGVNFFIDKIEEFSMAG